MSFSSDNFDGLRKLLKWKRHEQPPPRCMNEFSSRVIARLQAGEIEAKPSWWEILGLEFGLKPALGGACAVLVGGCLIYGIIASKNTTDQLARPGDENPGSFPGPGLATTPPGLPAAVPENFASSASSTNPILNPDPSLGGALRLQVKPVNFTPQN